MGAHHLKIPGGGTGSSCPLEIHLGAVCEPSCLNYVLCSGPYSKVLRPQSPELSFPRLSGAEAF